MMEGMMDDAPNKDIKSIEYDVHTRTSAAHQTELFKLI